MSISHDEMMMFRFPSESSMKPSDKVFEYKLLHLQTGYIFNRKIICLSAKHFYQLLAYFNASGTSKKDHTLIHYTDKYYE